MKTLEFKLDLKRSQQAKIEQWLPGLRWIWNQGLEFLEEHQQWRWCQKAGLYDENPVRWRMRSYTVQYRLKDGERPKLGKDESWPFGLYRELEDKKKQDKTVNPLIKETGFALCCDITAEESRRYGKADQLYQSDCRDYRPACTIRRLSGDNKPPISGETYFSLTNYFSKKNVAIAHPENLIFQEIPKVFAHGMCKTLTKAWSGYQDPKNPARRPKYKSKHKPIKTLITDQTKPNKKGTGGIKIDRNYINIPRLGTVKAKDLSERWPSGLEVATLKIIKLPKAEISY